MGIFNRKPKAQNSVNAGSRKTAGESGLEDFVLPDQSEIDNLRSQVEINAKNLEDKNKNFQDIISTHTGRTSHQGESLRERDATDNAFATMDEILKTPSSNEPTLDEYGLNQQELDDLHKKIDELTSRKSTNLETQQSVDEQIEKEKKEYENLINEQNEVLSSLNESLGLPKDYDKNSSLDMFDAVEKKLPDGQTLDVASNLNIEDQLKNYGYNESQINNLINQARNDLQQESLEFQERQQQPFSFDNPDGYLPEEDKLNPNAITLDDFTLDDETINQTQSTPEQQLDSEELQRAIQADLEEFKQAREDLKAGIRQASNQNLNSSTHKPTPETTQPKSAVDENRQALNDLLGQSRPDVGKTSPAKNINKKFDNIEKQNKDNIKNAEQNVLENVAHQKYIQERQQFVKPTTYKDERGLTHFDLHYNTDISNDSVVRLIQHEGKLFCQCTYDKIVYNVEENVKKQQELAQKFKEGKISEKDYNLHYSLAEKDKKIPRRQETTEWRQVTGLGADKQSRRFNSIICGTRKTLIGEQPLLIQCPEELGASIATLFHGKQIEAQNLNSKEQTNENEKQNIAQPQQPSVNQQEQIQVVEPEVVQQIDPVVENQPISVGPEIKSVDKPPVQEQMQKNNLPGFVQSKEATSFNEPEKEIGNFTGPTSNLPEGSGQVYHGTKIKRYAEKDPVTGAVLRDYYAFPYINEAGQNKYTIICNDHVESAKQGKPMYYMPFNGVENGRVCTLPTADGHLDLLSVDGITAVKARELNHSAEFFANLPLNPQNSDLFGYFANFPEHIPSHLIEEIGHEAFLFDLTESNKEDLTVAPVNPQTKEPVVLQQVENEIPQEEILQLGPSQKSEPKPMPNTNADIKSSKRVGQQLQFDDNIAINGKQFKGVSQNLEIDKKFGNHPNQVMSIVDSTLADGTKSNVLIAVSDSKTNEQVAIFSQVNSTNPQTGLSKEIVQLQLSEKFVADIKSANPNIQLPTTPPVNGFYHFEMDRVSFSKSGGIETGEVRGASKDFAVMLSAIGSQMMDANKNRSAVKMEEGSTLNMAISTDFIDKGLQNLNGCEMKAIKENEPLLSNLLVARHQYERAKAEMENKSPAPFNKEYAVAGSTSPIKMSSVPVYFEGREEPEYLNIIQRDGKSFAYMHTSNERGGKTIPKPWEINNISIESNGTEHDLYFGLIDGTHLRSVAVGGIDWTRSQESLTSLSETLSREFDLSKNLAERGNRQIANLSKEEQTKFGNIPVYQSPARADAKLESFNNISILSIKEGKEEQPEPVLENEIPPIIPPQTPKEVQPKPESYTPSIKQYVPLGNGNYKLVDPHLTKEQPKDINNIIYEEPIFYSDEPDVPEPISRINQPAPAQNNLTPPVQTSPILEDNINEPTPTVHANTNPTESSQTEKETEKPEKKRWEPTLTPPNPAVHSSLLGLAFIGVALSVFIPGMQIVAIAIALLDLAYNLEIINVVKKVASNILNFFEDRKERKKEKENEFAKYLEQSKQKSVALEQKQIAKLNDLKQQREKIQNDPTIPASKKKEMLDKLDENINKTAKKINEEQLKQKNYDNMLAKDQKDKEIQTQQNKINKTKAEREKIKKAKEADINEQNKKKSEAQKGKDNVQKEREQLGLLDSLNMKEQQGTLSEEEKEKLKALRSKFNKQKSEPADFESLREKEEAYQNSINDTMAKIEEIKNEKDAEISKRDNQIKTMEKDLEDLNKEEQNISKQINETLNEIEKPDEEKIENLKEQSNGLSNFELEPTEEQKANEEQNKEFTEPLFERSERSTDDEGKGQTENDGRNVGNQGRDL